MIDSLRALGFPKPKPKPNPSFHKEWRSSAGLLTTGSDTDVEIYRKFGLPTHPAIDRASIWLSLLTETSLPAARDALEAHGLLRLAQSLALILALALTLTLTLTLAVSGSGALTPNLSLTAIRCDSLTQTPTPTPTLTPTLTVTPTLTPTLTLTLTLTLTCGASSLPRPSASCAPG